MKPIIAFLWLLLAGTHVHAGTRVGVARVDITPEYPVRLSGFGFRRSESEGVTQKIWAKALAIGDSPASLAVLITVDNLGLPASQVKAVAGRLERNCGLDPTRLAVTASHTHTAPMLRGVAPTLFGVDIPVEHQERIDRYSRELTDRLVDVALRAIGDRREARVSWGLGSVDFAKNRRTAGGPVDHDLPLLVVREKGGALHAIATSYACHCVTLSNNRVSGDWAGYAQEHIETRFPGAVALLSVGCGGDQNPSSGVTGDRADIASAQGEAIAREVMRLVESPLTPLDGPPTVRHERIRLPLDRPRTREEWEQRAKQEGAVGYHARVNLARLDRGETLMTEIDYPIQTWAFGEELGMVFLAGEVVVDYSSRLKRELDPRRLWVNAYANHSPCYIPSERVLREGGYEGEGAMIYYDVPTRLAPGLEQKIIDVVTSQLGERFRPTEDASKTGGSLPKSPGQSASCLRVREGLRVELVASEPLVVDPVAIDFGTDGNLWVVEMHDYPLGLDGNLTPGGRIKILHDDDGDGRYDRGDIFLDDLPFPTGVMPWGEGAFVCAAPDILRAEDRDGDGKAEHVEKLFSGFETHNYQARVNSLRYGLDGWIYGAAGIFGGMITTASGEVVDLRNRDFRFGPSSAGIETVSGSTQHGRVRDEAGNWFGCDNGTLVRHYPMVESYMRRNPYVAPPPAEVFVPQGDDGTLFPATGQLVLFKLSGPPGRTTSACGLEIYRDELLGEGFRGNSFTCEPVNQLVHRRVLSPRGVTFAGRRAAGEERSEFLSSTDPWFRPVETRTGPDGALWIVDMYRYVIEHPRWIPEETLRTLDVRAGSDRGRIYRVLPHDGAPRHVPDLDDASPEMLVDTLAGPNGPLRDLAQQLLLARRPDAAVPLLERLAREAPRPESRLQALATLAGLEAISTTIVLASLEDTDGRVRRQAIRLAEALRPVGENVAEALAARIDDPDPQVRLQLAYSLGALAHPAAARALASLLAVPSGDEYIRAAVLSSIGERNIASVVSAAVDAPAPADGAGGRGHARAELARLAVLFGNADALRLAVSSSLGATARGEHIQSWNLLAGIFEALTASGIEPASILGDAILVDVAALVGRARAAVEDESGSPALRLAALSVLGFEAERRPHDLALLSSCLDPVNAIEIQSAAVERLGQIDDEAVPQSLLDRWTACGPALRARIVNTLLTRPHWATDLVEALEEGGVLLRDLGASSRQRLLLIEDSALHSRVETLVSAASKSAGESAALVRDALERSGDAERGKQIFLERCSSCHRLGSLGEDVGPDLAALTDRTPAMILTAVLEPDRNIDGRYLNYLALTRDGRSFTGLLREESSTAITLRSAEGDERTLLRSSLISLQASRSSFMPSGLADELSVDDLASLLAFVAGNSPPPRTIPGNQPRIVQSQTDGAINLQAESAEIYGGDITFEQPFHNIGFWHGEHDFIAWTLIVSADGRYEVVAEWACPDDSSGNGYVIEGGVETLRGRVESTGGWDRYRSHRIGTIELVAGTRRLLIRPDGPLLRGALMDLRALRLAPMAE